MLLLENYRLLHISLWFAPVVEKDLAFIEHTQPSLYSTYYLHIHTSSKPVVPSGYYWPFAFILHIFWKVEPQVLNECFLSGQILSFPGDDNWLLQSSVILLIQYYLSTPPGLWHNSYHETSFKFLLGNSLGLSVYRQAISSVLHLLISWFTSLFWCSFYSGSSLSSLGKGKRQAKFGNLQTLKCLHPHSWKCVCI